MARRRSFQQGLDTIGGPLRPDALETTLPLLIGLTASVVGALVAIVAAGGSRGWMYDANVYRLGADLVLHNADLYPPVAQHPFTYPPFAAILFIGLRALPEGLMAFALTAASIFCWLLVIWLCWGWVGVADMPRRLAATAVAAVITLWLDPVGATLLAGQVNLILLALIVIDLSLCDSSPVKGLGIGFATGVKLTPAFFVAYLLLTRRFRAALTSIAAFMLTIAVGFLLLPGDSLKYWSGTFLDGRRVGSAQNVRSQSIQSLLARWLHSTEVIPLWLGLDLAVAASVLGLAAWAHRRGDELLAACICGAGTLLVSPITWQHHWVWVVPILIWLAKEAVVRRSVAVAAGLVLLALDFLARLYTAIQVDDFVDLHLGPGDLLRSSTYALGMLAFLALSVAILIGALGLSIPRNPFVWMVKKPARRRR
ncbi:MAG: glycosyltransferase 87 family protein [Candidatus Dormibacteraeota bacterium]|nr:glycosyltransferase 87 family protein [Candidatus Dormibacteraeota bacterium]